MPTIALREKLMEKVANIKDDDVIEDILSWLEYEDKPSATYQFSTAEIERLDTIKKEVESGHFLSNDESNKLTDKWL